MRRAIQVLAVIYGITGASTTIHDAAAEIRKPTFRHPVALHFSADQKHLLVANRRSGSVSQINTRSNEVVNEYSVGQQLSDFIPVPNTNYFLATDERQHELVFLRFSSNELHVVQRVLVSRYPVRVSVSSDGRRAYVASLWSRRLTAVRWDDSLSSISPSSVSPLSVVTETIDLPFAPREQLMLDSRQRLIVADSHGGHLGVQDTDSNSLLFVHEFPAHNIRGLALGADGRKLIISQQMLNEVAHTVHNDVHWGLLMSNDLRWLELESVLNEDRWLYEDAHMVPLGGAGNATGDPAGLTVAANGTVVVALAGVNDVAFGKEDDYSLNRIDVGRRPTAVAVTPDGNTAYVANTLDDTVSVVDLTEERVRATVRLGTRPPLTLADRGERLFFDARLSHDGWMSCHSCHTDGHSNGLLNDNLSDGSYGAPKRVLSLLGRARQTAPFAWDASSDDLEEQIRKSIRNTMRGDHPPTDDQVAALAAYLDTLAAPPAIDLARQQRDEEAVARGKLVFESQRCASCHTPPAYTSPRTYNVGLTDEKGNNRFNPPPLLGVGQRDALLHDGRAKSLEDVFQKYRHRLRNEVTETQVRDLIAFLRSL